MPFFFHLKIYSAFQTNQTNRIQASKRRWDKMFHRAFKLFSVLPPSPPPPPSPPRRRPLAASSPPPPSPPPRCRPPRRRCTLASRCCSRRRPCCCCSPPPPSPPPSPPPFSPPPRRRPRQRPCRRRLAVAALAGTARPHLCHNRRRRHSTYACHPGTPPASPLLIRIRRRRIRCRRIRQPRHPPLHPLAAAALPPPHPLASAAAASSPPPPPPHPPPSNPVNVAPSSSTTRPAPANYRISSGALFVAAMIILFYLQGVKNLQGTAKF